MQIISFNGIGPNICLVIWIEGNGDLRVGFERQDGQFTTTPFLSPPDRKRIVGAIRAVIAGKQINNPDLDCDMKYRFILTDTRVAINFEIRGITAAHSRITVGREIAEKWAAALEPKEA
jgi:hypothetical protein